MVEATYRLLKSIIIRLLIASIYAAYIIIKMVIKCIITAPIVPTACLRVRYARYAFTRSVHQPLAYASGALIKH